MVSSYTFKNIVLVFIRPLISMHPFLNIADRAARLAGKTILEGLNRLDRLRMQHKQDNRGVVTEIDLKAERIIITTIQNIITTISSNFVIAIITPELVIIVARSYGVVAS